MSFLGNIDFAEYRISIIPKTDMMINSEKLTFKARHSTERGSVQYGNGTYSISMFISPQLFDEDNMRFLFAKKRMKTQRVGEWHKT